MQRIITHAAPVTFIHSKDFTSCTVNFAVLIQHWRVEFHTGSVGPTLCVQSTLRCILGGNRMQYSSSPRPSGLAVSHRSGLWIAALLNWCTPRPPNSKYSDYSNNSIRINSSQDTGADMSYTEGVRPIWSAPCVYTVRDLIDFETSVDLNIDKKMAHEITSTIQCRPMFEDKRLLGACTHDTIAATAAVVAKCIGCSEAKY